MLKLIEIHVVDGKVIPFYCYDIYLNSISSAIGKISVCIGNNVHDCFNGHVGCEIDELFRGNGYAKRAIMMTYEISMFHGMTHFIMTGDEDHDASKSVINKLGVST